MIFLPPPPPPPPEPNSVEAIPIPYGPAPKQMKPICLNDCFKSGYSTPKSTRNKNCINKEQLYTAVVPEQQNSSGLVQAEQNSSFLNETFQDNRSEPTQSLDTNECLKKEFSSPKDGNQNLDNKESKILNYQSQRPDRAEINSFSLKNGLFFGNRNCKEQQIDIPTWQKRRFHNHSYTDHQYRNGNRQYQSPQYQRRSWNSNSSKDEEKKFDAERYKHGWLFVDQDKYQREYFEKIFAETDTSSFKSEKFDDDLQNFKTAPIIFMFNLSPMVPFFTNKFCFSNHYMCERLKIDDIVFCCTEQYYMYYKARVFGDNHAMSEIMSTREPKVMKKIGSRVVGFDQSKWYKIAIQVMVIASIKKYEQNPSLRRQLFETCGAKLVETNPMDNRWGIALSLADWRIRDKLQWRGQNWLGRLLTILREKMLEREEFAAEKEELLREIRETMNTAKSVGCLQLGRSEHKPSDIEELAGEFTDDACVSFN